MSSKKEGRLKADERAENCEAICTRSLQRAAGGMQAERQWYALHVKTGSEEDVALDVYGISDADSLLPIEEFTIRTSKGVRQRRRVLMPGYVFVGCVMTPSVWQELRHLKGVLRILGEPCEAIPQEQMTNLVALYWHCVQGTKVVRVDGETQVVEGALMEVPHTITCADPRQGIITVEMDLPGGIREVTMHAEFITPGEQAGAEGGGSSIPHAGTPDQRRQAVP